MRAGPGLLLHTLLSTLLVQTTVAAKAPSAATFLALDEAVTLNNDGMVLMNKGGLLYPQRPRAAAAGHPPAVETSGECCRRRQ
jgi:hypothetical protein